ncbi:MAG: flavodoxin family protein [Eubacteriales bacterium]|nr:flavodoxin family protein [Eubacteriales bacterium]
MKVLLINGSPKAEGCTYTALKTVADELVNNGVEAEIVHVGTEAVRGCMGCGMCARNGSHKCIYTQDNVNMIIEKLHEADGLVIGSPVHYAAASGALTSTLDRVFYAGGSMACKIGASVVSCRRGGASAAFDQLNKYFTIAQMPIVSSNYWNQVHGNTPQEVLEDKEGIQTMQVLARNMAWLLKCVKAGQAAGVEKPKPAAKIKTNFIR